MNILIIGGTGFISGALVKKLLQKNHKVTLFNRGKTKKHFPPDENLDFIIGDRNKERSLSKALDGNTYDVVYDMIAYKAEESQSAANMFRNKIGRFVHCSTISVYMVSDEVVIPITEGQDKLPLMKYFPRNPFGMDYGINKRKCEDVLWRSHDEKAFPVSMLRPTYVSGPEDPARRDYFWIERINDGKPLLIPGKGDHKFQEVYIEDTAEAFCRVIETDKSIGEAYNVAAEEAFTLNEYLDQLSQLMDKKIEKNYIDQKQFDELDISYSPEGDVFPFNPRRDVVFSLDKIKRDLNYTSTPFKVWMKKTIDWFLNDYDKHSSGYSHRNKELSIIKKLKTG